MLKPGLPQDHIKDMSMSQLPPCNTLPQWSRINTLDKARYPKPFMKDRLQPLESHQKMDGDDKELDVSGMNPAQRVQYLERSLMFLRQEHSDVLRALHAEVDGLKKENKDLLHKVVMIQKSQLHKSPEIADLPAGNKSKLPSGTASREDRLDEVKVIFLEEEIKELKHALRETRNKNTYMQQLLEQSEEERKKQQATMESLKLQMSQGGSHGDNAHGVSQVTEQVGPSGHGTHALGGQSQSMVELQAVIRHLQHVNEQQAHELEGLKSDLRDVLYSHKWTPDAYLLAKAYVAEDDKKEESESDAKSALPQIPPAKDQRAKLHQVALVQDTVSLPALTQSMGTKAMERRKRTQMMQKAKIRRQMVPE